jgi:hypothetical protein
MARFLYPDHFEVGPPEPHLQWFQPLAEPKEQQVQGKKAGVLNAVMAAGLFWAPFVVPSEDITLDKWHAPLAEPYFAAVPAAESPASFFVPPFQIGNWSAHFAEPIYVIDFQYQANFLPLLDIEVPEVVTLDKWYAPLAEPPDGKPRASEFPAFVVDADALTRPEVEHPEAYQQQADAPVRLRRAADFSAAYWTTEGELAPVVPDFGWYVALDEPTRAKTAPEGFYARVEKIDLDFGWYKPLADPPAPPRRAADFSGLYWTRLEPPPPDAPDFGWYVRLAEPALPLPHADFPAFFVDADALTRPEVEHPETYQQQADAPHGAQRAADFSALYWTHLEDAAPAVPDFGWYAALQEPALARTAPGGIYARVDLVELDFGWHRPLSAPTRRLARVGDFSALYWTAEVIAPPAPDFGWYVALGEPVFLRTAPHGGALWTSRVEIAFDWFAALDEPTLPISRLPILAAAGPLNAVDFASITALIVQCPAARDGTWEVGARDGAFEVDLSDRTYEVDPV